MTFWTSLRRFFTGVDVDNDGKEFPAWQGVRVGETCLNPDCIVCQTAKYLRDPSTCYGANHRSRVQHYAKYKVNRRFVA